MFVKKWEKLLKKSLLKIWEKLLKRKKNLLKNGKIIFYKRFEKKWEKPKNGKKN